MSKIPFSFNATGRRLFDSERDAVERFNAKYAYALTIREGNKMLTAKEAVIKEKEELFKELRHFIGTQHTCPKYLTLGELYNILILLKVNEE